MLTVCCLDGFSRSQWCKQAGERAVWVGEMVIRSHDVYWPTPVFEESTQPLPPARARARRPVDA